MSKKPPSRRLFFAVWPDGVLRQALSDLQRQFSLNGGKPVHPEDLHLTLVFLGRVEQSRFPCVLAAADRVRTASFKLTLDSIGWWKRPHLLWCGSTAIPRQLERLVTGLQNELVNCGFEPEARTYRPHFTLARKAARVEESGLAQPLTMDANTFVLVETDSGAPPPHYRVLKKWSLDS